MPWLQAHLGRRLGIVRPGGERGPDVTPAEVLGGVDVNEFERPVGELPPPTRGEISGGRGAIELADLHAA